jgi:hypothetical protein
MHLRPMLAIAAENPANEWIVICHFGPFSMFSGKIPITDRVGKH